MDRIETLILESFAWTPHIETAAEIAISKVGKGEKVGFVFLNADNPDDLSRIIRGTNKRILGFSHKNKLKRLYKILREHGVSIIQSKRVTANIERDANHFAQLTPLNLEQLKGYTYKGAALGLAVASSLISRTKISQPHIPDHLDLVRRYLRSAATAFEESLSLLKEIKPKRIISFNGRFACAKGIFEAAHQLDIPSFYHERGSTFEKYSIHSKPVHDISYLRSEISRHWEQADSSKDSVGHRFFALRREGHGIGWTSFTTQQTKDLVPAHIEKRKIVYFSSSDDELAAVGNLVQQPIFPNQQTAIRFLIDWTNKRADTQLIIRVHPHLQKKSPIDLHWWLSLEDRNVTIIPPASSIDSYALMEWSDLVLSYGSTAGIEATYWGKPSILLGDSLYRGLDCVHEPSSEAETAQLLDSQSIAPLPRNNCLSYGCYFLSHGVKYEHYQPSNLFTGELCGTRLSPEPEWLTSAKSLIPMSTLSRIKRLLTGNRQVAQVPPARSSEK